MAINSDRVAKYAILVSVVVAVILLILMFIWYIYTNLDDSHFGSNILGNYKNPKEAKKILDWLNYEGLRLIDHMDKKYQNNPKSMTIVKRLLHKYNPDNLEENKPIPIPIPGNNSIMSRAYTTNFENISICLRKQDGSFYSKNIIMFVFLHELSHIGSMERKHEHEFWTVFKFIIIEAVGIGVIKPVNYEKYPFTYCGIEVKYNPYFDGNNISEYAEDYETMSNHIRGQQFDDTALAAGHTAATHPLTGGDTAAAQSLIYKK